MLGDHIWAQEKIEAELAPDLFRFQPKAHDLSPWDGHSGEEK